MTTAIIGTGGLGSTIFSMESGSKAQSGAPVARVLRALFPACRGTWRAVSLASAAADARTNLVVPR
jgi:hypothetical protein